LPSTSIYTIGHSTRSIEEFIEILSHYKIQLLVDIRSLPGSTRYPQFNSDNLEKSLEDAGIGYIHLKELGGLRKPKKDSINIGWRNSSFRGYADYMQTEEFDKALAKLMEFSKEKTVAIMCAEAVPWRCHRSLVGDALLVGGFEVLDVISTSAVRDHKLTPWAQVRGREITYPLESKRADTP
jgi:uncharacterized protein (DUF488 family)